MFPPPLPTVTVPVDMWVHTARIQSSEVGLSIYASELISLIFVA